MAPRRHKPAATATSSPGDDSEDRTGNISYGLDADAYGNDGVNGAAAVAAQGAADEDGDEDEYAVATDDAAADEYDGNDEDEHGAAEDEYDDDDSDATSDEYDEYAEYDGNDEDDDTDSTDFAPPTALSAIRNVFRSPRQRAQPASGTAEDEARVSFIDKRERLIGYVLGVAMVALAVVGYYYDSHFVDAKDITLQNAYRHEAPWVLLITMFLGVMILLATYFKRRAAVGFTLLLAGIANLGVDPIIGFVYLGTGLWLVFRSMKRSPRARRGAGATSRAGGATRAGAGTRAGGATRAESRASMAAAGRARAESESARSSATIRSSAPGRTIGKNRRLASTPTSGRYTPPKPTRYAPPAVQPEPEPTNRLSSWLKK